MATRKVAPKRSPKKRPAKVDPPTWAKAPPVQQLNIMQEAMQIIYGDREKTYGSPDINLQSIADFWTVFLRRKKAATGVVNTVTINDVCQMMILVKQARLINDPTHRDSQVDVVGYAALMERCQNL